MPKSYIIITGKPRSGKSTLVLKLSEKLKSMNISIAGLITPELKDQNRYGFEIIGISSGKRKILALEKSRTSEKSKYKLGKYIVFTENFVEIFEEEIKNPKDVFIIDEVGPMEIPSRKIQGSFLEELKKSEIKTVIITVKKDMVQEIKDFFTQDNIIDIDEIGADLAYAYALEKSTGTDAFLFDLDGVIIDSSEFHKQSWVVLMSSKGINFSEEDFKITFGKRNEEILKDYFPDLPESEIKKMSYEKEELYRKLAKGNIKPIDGSIDTLRLIRENGFKIALVSSTPKENIDFIFKELKLDNFFDAVVSGTDIKQGKPNPECYLIAAAKLGVKPQRCYVVEDSEHGLEAGKRSGAKCIGITTTHKKLKNADIVVNNFYEMNELIKKVILELK